MVRESIKALEVCRIERRSLVLVQALGRQQPTGVRHDVDQVARGREVAETRDASITRHRLNVIRRVRPAWSVRGFAR